MYPSTDARTWTRQADALLDRPGQGEDDRVKGGHADVVVSEDRVFLFYFTHPGRRGADEWKDGCEQRRSSILAAELESKDGALTCDGDQPTFIRLVPPTAPSAARSETHAYRVTFSTSNGEDGLHLAWISDGYRWETLNGGKSCLHPRVGESKRMRDPCLLQGPEGRFHLVWTTSWNGRTTGYAHSTHLTDWSKACVVTNHHDDCTT